METDIANTTMAKAKASLITSGIREKFGTVGTGSLETKGQKIVNILLQGNLSTPKPVYCVSLLYFTLISMTF